MARAARLLEPPLALEGAADRFDYWETEPDYFTQPGTDVRHQRSGTAASAV